MRPPIVWLKNPIPIRFDLPIPSRCLNRDELISFAEERGYRQYEIANFARNPSGRVGEIPDRACRHNVNYWRGGSFHGLGPSATGYVRGVRSRNWSNTQMYCEQIEKGRRAVESSETLPSLARAGELAAFGLRMNAGWPLMEFKTRTGHELTGEWSPEIGRLVGLGYGRLDGERFQLTRQGLRYADWVAEQFLRS